MKRCNKECYALCDFCKHYSFNGEDMERKDHLTGKKRTFKGALYTGNGYCNLHKEHRDPEERCNDFVCEMTTIKGKWSMFLFKISNHIIHTDLSVGKQKGFSLQIGWIYLKVILLGKKFIFEFSITN